ncbi:MAG: hypothetical protein ACREOV_03855 [Candidatus Dormibacteraceae bacterium]
MSTVWGEPQFLFARPEHATAESLFVDLTRGKRANYVFFAGERRPDEDVHLPAPRTTTPEQLLQKAMQRESAKAMALDLITEARAQGAQGVAAPATQIDWGSSPATEKQLAWIADLGREGLANGRPLTWAEASLVIDGTGSAMVSWLREQGATEAETRDVQEAAARTLRGVDVADQLQPDASVNALDALVERLEQRAASGQASATERQMLATSRHWASSLPREKTPDRGGDLLERRVGQLEAMPERSQAQEAERRRLVDRRALLRGPQKPSGPGPQPPPSAARDVGRRPPRP